MTLSPCRTLQNVIQTQKCVLCREYAKPNRCVFKCFAYGAYGRTLSPDLLSSFSLLQNCYFLNFNHWKYGLYVNVGQSMLLNEVVHLRCLLQIYAPKIFESWLSAKKASASGDCVPKTPTKFDTSFTSYNHCWFVQNANNNEHIPRTICYLFQIFASNMHQNEWHLLLCFRPRSSGASFAAPIRTSLSIFN